MLDLTTLPAKDSLGVFSGAANTEAPANAYEWLRVWVPLAPTAVKGTEALGLCVTQSADGTCLVPSMTSAGLRSP